MEFPISTADANQHGQSWQATVRGEPLCAGLITPDGTQVSHLMPVSEEVVNIRSTLADP